MKFKLSVIIGRFRPWHKGHQEMLDYAKSISDKTIVIVGSANQAPSQKNPFSVSQVSKMIKEINDNVDVFKIDDYDDDNIWSALCTLIVSEYYRGYYKEDGTKDDICLVGRFKDESSYYLNLFPEYTLSPFSGGQYKGINATDIRNELYKAATKGATLDRHFFLERMDVKTAFYMEELLKDGFFNQFILGFSENDKNLK